MAPLDEAIAQVVVVTNTTPERAAQYVQLADGDPDQAVTLFFENDGADLAGIAVSPAAPQPPQSTAYRSRGQDSSHPIDVDESNTVNPADSEITGYGHSSSHGHADIVDEDARLAQRLQEEAYGESDQDAVVRAPIARQAETLLGPGADLSAGPVSDQVNRRMWEFQQRRGRGHQQPGIFNQRETSAIWDGEEDDDEREVLAQATGGASEASSKSNTLARLFQPPWELMFKEPWDVARSTGREQQKWIMVNIQDGSVFACQVLNRDLWKNPSVVDTIKENFIFIQYSKEDPRAEQYTQYYFPEHQNSDLYPHISIIDPRTGEQVKLWSRNVPNAAEFLMQIHEFLDRYSLSHEARNPVAKRKSETAKQKSIDQMTEDELLQIAMQESLAAQNNQLKPPAVEDPDDLTRSIGDLRKGGSDESQYSRDDAMSDDAGATAPTPFSRIPSDRLHIEPAVGPGVTRIQLRHRAGRIIRRFALTDRVRVIYEYLKSEPLEDKEGAEFELVSMGKNLIESIDNTIEQAGLKNGTIMLEFVRAEQV